MHTKKQQTPKYSIITTIMYTDKNENQQVPFIIPLWNINTEQTDPDESAFFPAQNHLHSQLG